MSEIFSCILKLSVDASYMIVAVILARLLLRKSSKVFRKILWILVGVRLAVPFSFESVLSLVPQNTNVISNGNTTGGNVTSVPAQTVVNESFNFLQILPVVWAVVAVGLLIYGLISFIRLKRKISDAVRFKDNIYQSEKVNSPFVCGFVKPKIYIPYNLDKNTYNCVVKHEKTHIKYFDHILKAFGFVLLCVHWFNPLVWVGYILFCKDIELLCDELVVKNMSTKNRKKYAKALCNIGIEKIKVSACPIAFGEVGIKERVKNTVNYKKVKLAFLIISAVTCVAVAVCFMTTPVKAQEEKTELKPEPATDIVETTEPVTLPEIVPVTEVPETTEPTTEEVTEEIVETTAELYDEEEEVESLPFDEEELARQMELERQKLQFRHEQELEEYRRKREDARLQKEYNEKSENHAKGYNSGNSSSGPVSVFDNLTKYNSHNNYSNYGVSGPTGGSPVPSVPSLFQ